MPESKFNLAGRTVGLGQPCFVIAEAGVNHNGSLDQAMQLVDVAAAAGADAVKFQTFKAIRLVTCDAPKADYQSRNDGASESQLEMLRRLELSPEMHEKLIDRCKQLDLLFMSTPFDEESADFLDTMGVCLFKTPSGEITNLPYLAHVARKGKPLVVSTGMSSLGEVETAVEAIESTGNQQFVLLHCVSNYPAAPRDVNLSAMQTLQTAFQVPVGYSDHTLGSEVGLAAAALGASVIEKHFTLDRGLPGPDHAASLEPDELTGFIRGIRTVEQALGDGRKRTMLSEANTAAVARKSLVASKYIPAGTVLTDEFVAAKRPGTGLPPTMRDHLLQRIARVDIPEGALIKLEMVA